jgi:Rrf2 family transcriptional regulator, cysteine metabolism repressor
MKIPARGRYGVRALVDIAMNEHGGPVLIRDIAERQQISLLYLQQVLNPLIAGGLVKSTRGPGGGVALSKAASDITMTNVLQLLIGPVVPVECVNDPKCCSRSKDCATRDTWVQLEKSMNGVLDATTIQNLVDRQRVKNQVKDSSYQI